MNLQAQAQRIANEHLARQEHIARISRFPSSAVDPAACPVPGCERGDACDDPRHVPPEVPDLVADGRLRASGPAGRALVRDRAPLIAYTFDELGAIKFPARRPLLVDDNDEPLLREKQGVLVFAERGTGKSFFIGSLAIAVASGCRFLRWQAPQARKVLLVDGEMPGEALRSRLHMLAPRMGVSSCPLLNIIAADWQEDPLPRLDTPAGLALIEPFITDNLELLILDNASCLFDPASETDPEAWQPAKEWLLSLRRRGISVVLVHHASRTGTSRGHSRREDDLDLVMKLSRPDDYVADQGARFKVEFTKSRGVFGPAVSPFVAALEDGIWSVEGCAVPQSRRTILRQRIEAWLVANTAQTKAEIVANVTGREQDIRREVDDLAEEGRLSKVDGRFSLALR